MSVTLPAGKRGGGGVILPERSLGKKSLAFRSKYLVVCVCVFQSSTWRETRRLTATVSIEPAAHPL